MGYPKNMKEYKFSASMPIDDLILGIGFPAVLMLPTLVLGLLAWCLIPGYHPLSKSMSGFGWVAVPGVVISFVLLEWLKKKTVHEYIVKVRGTSIGFYRAGTLQCQGKLNSITMQQSPLKTCLEMKINDMKIIFIVRPKENYIRNSFLATGSLYDVEVMEELYHDLSQGTV